MKILSIIGIVGILLLSACTEVVILEPADDSNWTDGSDVGVTIEFSGRIPLDVSTFSATLNGIDQTSLFTVDPSGASATLTGLGVGEYLLEASVGDILGKSGSGLVSFEVVTGAPAVAKEVEGTADLIGGPMARGRIDPANPDYLLENDKIRVIISAAGRDPVGFVSPFGGNIIDADLVRAPGEPGNDQFMAMSPLINIESTFHVTDIQVINDGSNGGPAMLRATGVDDSLDFINASQLIKVAGGGLPLNVPPSADDVDIPVELVTEYSLNPGDNYVKMETFIKNVGSAVLGVYIGDWLVGAAGELNQFVPGLGFGEPIARLNIDYIAFRGEASASGLAYGYIPEVFQNSTAFSETGVMATSLGQSIINILILGAGPVVRIPAGGVASYVRYFVVGEDAGSIHDARNEIFDEDTGLLGGTVEVGTTPLEGATVAVVKTPGAFGAAYDVITTFETDVSGEFQGSLPPGDYQVMVAKEGYPYDSGSQTPNAQPVSITSGVLTEVALVLPDTGRLRVTAVDELGADTPAKASVVGFDPSPPLANTQSVLGLLDLNGSVFDDDRGEGAFGVSKAIFMGVDGDSGEILIEPGTYQVVVSRGPEYSLFTEPIGISAGNLTESNAEIARVVDTAGFVSGDFHVHMINSPDSVVPLHERVITFLAEGVDYLVATDHAYLTDLGPTVSDLGAGDLISTSVGQEITPQDYGHYNGWPLTLDPNRRSNGAIDWAREELTPGQDYRTLGAYCLSPGEIYDAVHADPGLHNMVQINHFNSGGGAGLNILGIDTGAVPPISTVDPEPFRLDPSIANLFDPDFDGLELLIGNDRGQIATFFDENLGDWFNLLNQGLIYAGTSDSDTHRKNKTQAGVFRNYIASTTDDPGLIDEDELTLNTKEGRTVGGYSPFLKATVSVTSPVAQTGGHALAYSTTVVTTDNGTATFHLEMQSPLWIEFDTIELYINNIPDPVDDDGNPGTPPQYLATPDVVLRAADGDFDIILVNDYPAIDGASHWEAELDYDLTGLTEDTWIVALVRGTDGTSEPMFPVVPNDLVVDGNATLADLLDGNLDEGGILALSFTNPLYIDTDGNGVYDAPFAP
jgi:hypothetical protein